MTSTKKVLVGAVIVLIVAQLVPYPPAENPPVTQEVQTTAEVRAVLSESCFDCHSHETQWPWYSHVIPTKWFVRGHVAEGRESLNFSTWDTYPPDRAAHKLEEVVEMVEEGSMPLSSYIRMHPGADLTVEEREQILAWARSLMGPVPPEGEGGVAPGVEPTSEAGS